MRFSSQRRWLLARLAYRAALVGFFLLVAFEVGPNYFNYHRLVAPAPSSYLDLVNGSCAPALREMAVYNRSVEQASRSRNPSPPYLPSELRARALVAPDGGVVFPFYEKRIRIRYSVTSGHGVWTVEGPGFSGIVPAPPVPDYWPIQQSALNP